MISIDGAKKIRRDKRKRFIAVMVFVMMFSFTFLVQRFRKANDAAEAANLGNFDPGYIMSDYQMSRYDSMSEAEIQEFLTAKGPCNNTDSGLYGRLMAAYAPSYNWHFKDGHFVCLAEELFGDGEVVGEGETAAHIIWQAAQDYKINPQVLIVLLQKEQGLITDNYPHSRQYRSATGYGCPDTAPCATEYYGFKNQVRKAVALFRTVLDGGWTNYPLGDNYVQYNPASSCGGTMVNIRSLATSALYRYTPYQPNAAALSAGYGYGDSCSAYGNRNFYVYFEDWVGGAGEEIDNSPMGQIKRVINAYSAILGAQVTELNEEADGRKWQTFQNGTVIYSEGAGAHVVLNGAVADKWAGSGGSLGTLGKPISDTFIEPDGRHWQTFENGTIIYHETTGANIVFNGSIADRWAKSGGSYGTLGKPKSDAVKNEKWVYQSFEKGGIFSSIVDDKTIAIEDVELFNGWVKNVFEEGIDLGYPVSMTFIEYDGRHWQTYEKGTMIYHNDSGAVTVLNGPIADMWAKSGGSYGSYGRPVSNQKDGSRFIYQVFERGAILLDSNTGEILGIVDKYIFDKWLNNVALGKPISDTFIEPDGRHWQTFENGTIIYHETTGANIVFNGSIADRWAKSGGSYGTLGKPKSDAVKNEKWVYQSFEKGGIFSSIVDDKTIAIEDVELFNGWVKNVFEEGIDLGYPVSMTFIEYDGRHWQTYEKGTMIYHNDSGAVTVLNGPIADMWAKSGGSYGSYGRPVSNQKDVDGKVIQEFLYGAIEASAI
ncbi:MAG: hypothetical protein Q4A79_00065 [Candidatus Saccharibacteria bacterium]|nr:hypothetical protein [Candidatus Saccharibacteria bacterium]